MAGEQYVYEIPGSPGTYGVVFGGAPQDVAGSGVDITNLDAVQRYYDAIGGGGFTGGAAPPPAATGGGTAPPPAVTGTVDTPNGPRTLEQIIQEMRVASGNPNYGAGMSAADIVKNYSQTVLGGKAATLAKVSGGAYDWESLWGAMGDTNQQLFDFEKDKFRMSFEEGVRQFDIAQQFSEKQLAQSGSQYDQGLAWEREQFAANQAATDAANKQSLALSLLNTASGLTGPRDWQKYSAYTSGGQNIFDRMATGEAAPAFGQPTGYTQVQNIYGVLSDLGLVPRQDTQSQVQSTPDAVSKALAPLTGGGATMAQAGSTAAPISNNQQAVLPYQMNPGTWASMSDSAKQVYLASVEGGNTPSGAWNADDYLRQMAASTPKGATPMGSTYQWQTPRGYST